MTDKSFQEAYYEAESFWSDGALTDTGNRRRMVATAGLVPTGCTSILDVGCGNGVFGALLLELRPEINLIGVDRSHMALKYAKFETKLGSSEKLPFPDKSFDCVTCLQVVEHLPWGAYQSSLAELVRVSRKYVIVSVPYREKIEDNCTTCPSCRTRFNIDLHLRSFDDHAVKTLFPPGTARLDSVAFPVETTRLRWIGSLRQSVRRLNEHSEHRFLSPICPVCGYSEGDRTALAHQRETAARETNRQLSSVAQLSRAAWRRVKPFWPTERDAGYWIICRYECTPASPQT